MPIDYTSDSTPPMSNIGQGDYPSTAVYQNNYQGYGYSPNPSLNINAGNPNPINPNQSIAPQFRTDQGLRPDTFGDNNYRATRHQAMDYNNDGTVDANEAAFFQWPDWNGGGRGGFGSVNLGGSGRGGGDAGGVPTFAPSGYFDRGNPGYIGYGQSRGSREANMIMASQAYGGNPNNTGNTGDAGRTIFNIGPGTRFIGRMEDGILTHVPSQGYTGQRWWKPSQAQSQDRGAPILSSMDPTSGARYNAWLTAQPEYQASSGYQALLASNG